MGRGRRINGERERMEEGEEEEVIGRGSWRKVLFYCFSCFSDFFPPLISHSDFKLPISSFCLSHSLSPSFLSLSHSVSLHLSLSLSLSLSLFLSLPLPYSRKIMRKKWESNLIHRVIFIWPFFILWKTSKNQNESDSI